VKKKSDRKMDSSNVLNLYNHLLHQQRSSYAFPYVALLTQGQIKEEPVAIAEMDISEVHPTPSKNISSTMNNTPPASTPSPTAMHHISLDTEIPRDEIEGDIEVMLVRNLQDTLRTLGTSLCGLRGKKFGFREVLDLTSGRPIYPSGNTSLKRDRTSSFGSTASLLPENNEPVVKKPKMEKVALNSSSNEEDEGRLVIDWEEEGADKPENVEEEKKEVKIIKKEEVKKDDYKPSTLRFERLKQIQKKKPRFNSDNLDLTYHSNMARQFPGTENRSEEQQHRRDKNTLAARVSRNKNKAYEKYLEEKSIDATVENVNLKRRVACLREYANSLMKMTGITDVDFSKMFDENIKELMYTTDDH
jgi:hypothetical protein